VSLSDLKSQTPIRQTNQLLKTAQLKITRAKSPRRKDFSETNQLLKTALLKEVDFDEGRKKKTRFLFSASL